MVTADTAFTFVSESSKLSTLDSVTPHRGCLMPANAARKAAREGKFKIFVYNGQQRIVDGVRYDILPPPAAQGSTSAEMVAHNYNSDHYDTTLRPIPHTIRRGQAKT